jgi:hypothetical protein
MYCQATRRKECVESAITQSAVFEAVNAINKDFDPCLGTVIS